MKKLTFTLGLMLFVFASFSQTNDLQVISSAGDYFVGTEITLSWTLGETVIETFINEEAGIMLTQGFQQGDFSLTPTIYTVTLLANPDNIGAELTGGGDYIEGDLVNITASAVTGYNFIGWSGNPDDVALLEDAEGTITSFIMPDRAVALTANYQLTDYLVTVIISPEGAGTVTGDGIYNMGEEVTLTAIDGEGYVFMNWRIGETPYSSENPLIFNMPAADVTYTAYFIEVGVETYTLTLLSNPDGIGAVLTGAGDYEEAANVTITTTSVSGFNFIGWEGEDNDVALLTDPTALSTTFVMPTRDITLTATYELIPPTYTLTLLSEPEGIGAVLIGANNYLEGAEVNISASTVEGYTFIGWTGAPDDLELLADALAMGTSFIMPDRNITFTASYELIPPTYTLSLATDPEGIGATLVGNGSYLENSEVTISTTAVLGYDFVGWTGEAEDIALLNNATALETTFDMPNRDVALTASYQLIEYTLTVVIDPVGAGSVSGDGIYNMGDVVSLEATANTGYQFLNWLINGNVVSSGNPYIFNMPAENITITAFFIDENVEIYSVTLLADPNDIGAILSGDGTYIGGQNVNIAASTVTGYSFIAWTGTTEDIALLDDASAASTSFVMPTRNIALTASYEALPPPQYSLTISVVGNGSVEVEGTAYTIPVVVDEGTILDLEAIAEIGWQFDGWSGDLVSTDAIETITMNTDKAITATFSEIPPTQYSLTVTIVGSGTVEVDGNVYTDVIEVVEGTILDLEAIAATGWQFEGWTGDLVSSDEIETITMNADKAITATFTEIPVQYGLTIMIVGNGTVEVDGIEYIDVVVVDDGTILDLEAIADEGWQFDGWSGDLVSTNTSETVTMNANKAITATFSQIPPVEYTLTLNIVGNGTVEVNGSVYEVALSIVEGSDVELEAFAELGWEFEGWTGDLISTDAFETITMDADKAITATFIEIPPIQYTLTVTVVGSGSVEVEGNTYTVPVLVDEGTILDLEAIAANNWQFVGWTGDLESANAVETIAMDADKAVTATFVEIVIITEFPWLEEFEGAAFPPASWLGLDVDELGTQWATTATQAHSPTQSAFHSYAPAAAGYQEGWLITPAIVIPANGVYELTFWSYNMWAADYGKNSVLISTGSSNPNDDEYLEVWTTESVTQEWVQSTVNLEGFAGETIFVAFLYEGLYAHSWFLDDVMVAEQAQPQEYVLTLLANPNNIGAVLTGAGSYIEGANINISATAVEDYIFIGWVGTSEDMALLDDPTALTTSFVMPSRDVTFTATYNEDIPDTYTVTFTVTDEEQIAIEGATILIGGVIELTSNANGIATIDLPNGGYAFTATADNFEDFEGSFTVNSEALNVSVAMTPVAVNHNPLSMLRVYPNPFRNSITLENAKGVSRVVIVNLIGQKVLEIQLSGNDRITIPTTELVNGIYMMQFIGENGEKIIRKMVKE
jgi:uncharacterized repeat protein (TIGR02543 family)